MKISNNEKGIALVLSLVMIALLSILGAYALSTSSTELFIAGNYRNSELAFSSADAGTEFGLNQVRLNSPLAWPVAGAGDSPVSSNYNTVSVSTNRADVQVTRVTIGDRPSVGIKGASGNLSVRESSNERGNAGALTAAAYYVVHSIGYGPSNSQIEVECMLWRPAMEEGLK